LPKSIAPRGPHKKPRGPHVARGPCIWEPWSNLYRGGSIQ